VSWSADADERLRRWLRALVETPGLTAIRDLEEARLALLDDSLRGADLVASITGPIVDVGSGGGVPGIPLAVSLPDREVTLLEANGRKCRFLREWAPPNARVLQGRAEEQETDVYGVAVAKALAPPPVAAEWCLPLVSPGGAAVLWVGPSADTDRVARVAGRLAGELVEERDGLLVLRKLRPTPEGFPRRTGVARKRPLR
jgi:16S rRNA (guanine527-N7)-methyltransferase